MMLEQKPPVFPQQYASQTQMAQGSYNPMQDPNFHTMGQRPNYTTLRMQPRPGLRPTGIVQNQPNQLRLQLQHRLQAQQNRQPLMNQISGVSNVNLTLRPGVPTQVRSRSCHFPSTEQPPSPTPASALPSLCDLSSPSPSDPLFEFLVPPSLPGSADSCNTQEFILQKVPTILDSSAGQSSYESMGSALPSVLCTTLLSACQCVTGFCGVTEKMFHVYVIY